MENKSDGDIVRYSHSVPPQCSQQVLRQLLFYLLPSLTCFPSTELNSHGGISLSAFFRSCFEAVPTESNTVSEGSKKRINRRNKGNYNQLFAARSKRISLWDCEIHFATEP